MERLLIIRLLDNEIQLFCEKYKGGTRCSS
jgi:hypothetical protein